MKRYVTIDGGTTNTRISLVEEGRVKDTLRLSLGARANAEEKGVLDLAVKQGIAALLEKHSLGEADIVACLASGMITSDMGLYTVAHIKAPAGIAELHRAMATTALPHICGIPFYFIPGVKTEGTLAQSDLMRGEETELFGLFDGVPENATVILPGSHSKIIRVDEKGRIATFKTMLTGEMLASLSAYTILKASVDIKEGSLEESALLDGYAYAEAHGINEALFKVRVMRQALGASHNEAYSFLLGAVLHGEVSEIIKEGRKRIYVGGRLSIKEATVALLNYLGKEAVAVDEDAVNASTARGLVRIYEYTE